MRASWAARCGPRRVRRSTSKGRKAPRCWCANNQQPGRSSMFWKTAIALIATIAVAIVWRNNTATVTVFVIAMFVVFVVEGVRIVPQQNAWVVERLGKFARILEPGPNLIV